MNGRPLRDHTAASLGIAGAIVIFLVALPALITVAIYTFLTVYAIVKAIGSAPDSASPPAVLLGVVMLVTMFATLLGVAIGLLGRSLDPKKSGPKRRDPRRRRLLRAPWRRRSYPTAP